MSAALVLGLVGGLLILAFVANRVFSVTRIPDVVILMVLGIVLGPVMHLVNAASLSRTTHLLGTLAIILVLFEGGLELDLREILRHFSGSLVLAVLAYVFSTGLVALIVSKGLGVSLSASLLVGAVVGCTSSAVVLPVLQQMKADEPLRVTLTLEASWGDVLAVLVVGLLIGMRNHSGPIATGVLNGVLMQVGVASLFAIIAGVLWSRLLPVLWEQRFWQVLTFSIVLVLYAGMEAMGANGLIAVLAFGMTLANFPGLDADLLGGIGSKSHQALLTFHSELAFLVRTFFFVLIGAIAEVETFREHPLLMAGTVAALFLARWLAIQASRWTLREIDSEQRETLLWMLPRGLITVVLAIEAVQAIGSSLSFLPGLAFAVILATNLMVVLGSWRIRRRQPAVAAAGPVETGTGESANHEPILVPVVSKKGRRPRWAVNAALLALLAIGGVLLWYGNQPPGSRPASMQHLMEMLRH